MKNKKGCVEKMKEENNMTNGERIKTISSVDELADVMRGAVIIHDSTKDLIEWLKQEVE